MPSFPPKRITSRKIMWEPVAEPKECRQKKTEIRRQVTQYDGGPYGSRTRLSRLKISRPNR